MQDEGLIIEMMWIAFRNGKGIELAEAAGTYIHHHKVSKLDAYKKAFSNLGLKFE